MSRKNMALIRAEGSDAPRRNPFIALAACLLLFLPLSCKQQTIFYQIEQETELEEAVIGGTVVSIVEFNGRAYACNGLIYSKDKDAVRGWEKAAKPGGFVTRLAVSGNTLYAETSDGKVYTSADGSSWQESAEAMPSGITASNSSSGVTYTAESGTVTDSFGGTASDLGTIHSLTYSAADNSVYAGTDTGLKRLPIGDDGKLTGEKKDPPGNWSSTIKEYEIYSVLATGTSADDAALYVGVAEAGSAYSTVGGMWSYYFNRRDSWNVE